MFVTLPPDQALCGIRFQPIFSLREKQIQSWEVLSILHPELNHEHFFANQSEDFYLNVLCWQLQAVNKINNHKRYYFNVPARILCQQEWVGHITRFLRRGLVIEIQDPQGFISLSAADKKSFKRSLQCIRATGAEIWLDDLLPEYLPDVMSDLVLFDGIKIDKSLLSTSSYSPAILKKLIADCLTKVKSTLVEGIEHHQHFALTESAGCQFLQGFMWPEQRLKLRYTPVLNG